jgi:gliding motility-associated-like protein
MNVQMKNGNNLLGDRSSTQNAVIIPQSGSNNLYIVFMVASIQLQDIGLTYSVVDINGDNGLGEVIQKNVPLLLDTYEKITAVRHCNKNDTWVTVRKWNSDQYYTYLVGPNGVNPTPVISSTGFIVNGSTTNAVGAIKFNSKGTKLAAAFGYGYDKVELLDFDNQTGILSNSKVFRANTFAAPLEFSGTYGIEFSPDNSKLYVSAGNSLQQPAHLYQLDVTTNSLTTILASRVLISNTVGFNIGNIQIAPDKKLYVAYTGAHFLGVINNPNATGLACNYQYNGFTLPADPNIECQLGLPTFDQSIFDPSFSTYYISADSTGCTNLTRQFRLSTHTGFDSLVWDFGDGQLSRLIEPVHTYTSPGTYYVSLTIYRVTCAGNSEVYTTKMWIAASGFLGNDFSACAPVKNIQIGYTGPVGSTYLWNTGATTEFIKADTEGIYWLKLTYNKCVIADTVEIIAKPTPQVNIGPDTPLCKGQVIQFNAGNTGALYLWNTGETSQIINTTKTGMYAVKVSFNGCVSSDTAFVLLGDCQLFIPTAFTPNGDQLNDLFGVIGEFANTNFRFRVYDRFGHVVFSAKTISDKWDGTYKTLPLPMSVYPWIIQYNNIKGEKKTYKGTVILIR